MGGFVNVIPNGLDIVVHVWVHVLLALFVVNASLHDMKKVRNDAAGGEALTHVVEVESPRIGQTLGENFEFLRLGMKTPDSTVYEFTVFLCGARLPDLRSSEHPMASVHPTVRTPNEAIESFVTVMNSPTIEQNLVRTVRYAITIGIGNEDQFGWHADETPPMPTAIPELKSKVLGKSLFLVEHAVPIDVLENLYADSFCPWNEPVGSDSYNSPKSRADHENRNKRQWLLRYQARPRTP